jgi:hypothetical protein
MPFADGGVKERVAGVKALIQCEGETVEMACIARQMDSEQVKTDKPWADMFHPHPPTLSCEHMVVTLTLYPNFSPRDARSPCYG